MRREGPEYGTRPVGAQRRRFSEKRRPSVWNNSHGLELDEEVRMSETGVAGERDQRIGSLFPAALEEFERRLEGLALDA